MSKINDERRKLFADLATSMANGCFVVGVVAPLAAVLYRQGKESQIPPDALFSGVPSWLATVAGLHLVGQWILGGLEDE